MFKKGAAVLLALGLVALATAQTATAQTATAQTATAQTGTAQTARTATSTQRQAATSATRTTPATAGTSTTSAQSPRPLVTDLGGIRVSRVLGSSVYNDREQKIGNVDDIIIGADKSLHAVLSVGGFLGMGSKMVEVPYEKLRFGSARSTSENRVVMPGVTKEALDELPEFHYARQG